jgi:tetratricopeptide (TPR) repeat protein
VLGGVQPARGQFDQVYIVKGAPIRGKVTETDKDTVKIDTGDTVRPVPVNEILRVTFASEPSELNNARNAAFQKNFSLGLNELRKLDGAKLERDLIKQDVEFYKALCQARLAINEGGDKSAAAKAMLNFVSTNRNTYHFYDAAEVLGDLAFSAGQNAEAAKYYGSIARAPWADFQMRGNYAEGRALAADKQYDQALARYEKVIAGELSTPEAVRMKLLATVGKGMCLAETGKTDEGIALLHEIVEKNDPQDVPLFARTYNALGRCYLKANKPKEAVLAFLHTDVLFSSDADSHAEALYYLSKLWPQINRSDRALTARNTLRERYAGTIWANLD